MSVGIRKCDASKMMCQLLQAMYPSIKKVTISRLGGPSKIYNIKVKRAGNPNCIELTSPTDDMMKVLMKELDRVEIKEKD